MRPLTSAVVGVGNIGAKRAAAMAAARGFELRALIDHDTRRAQSLAGELGGPTIHVGSSWEELLNAKVDFVVVATPTAAHEELACRLLLAEKHVLVEKPLSSDLESCRRMLRTAELSGRQLKVGFNYPYRAPVKTAIACWRSGLLGQILHARATIGHGQFVDSVDDRTRHFVDPEAGGGSSLSDLGIHPVDLGRLFMGNFELAYGLGSQGHVFPDFEVEEVALASFTTKSGRLFSVTASFIEHRPWMGLQFEMLGRRARLNFRLAPNEVELMIREDAESEPDAMAQRSHDRLRSTLREYGVPEPQRFDSRLLHRKSPKLVYSQHRLEFSEDDPSLAEELDEFAAAVHGQPASPCFRAAEAGLAAQQMIEAAQLSARQHGTAVDVESLGLATNRPAIHT